MAKEKILKGDFILEYTGEIISAETCIQRTLDYKSTNHYFLNYDQTEVIDGTKMSSLARYVNHSCNPNLTIEKWYIRTIIHKDCRR